MSQEVTINPFFLTIDIVDKAIDYNSFLDYLKSEHKKDVIIVNGLDYADVSRGNSKQGSRSSRMGQYDSTISVVKGMKAKITQDIAKLLDTKKKQLAQIEKAKNSSHKSKTKFVPEPVKYDGKIDAIFFIINFPYLPHQLSAMTDNEIGIDAFITIKPDHDFKPGAFHSNYQIKSSGKANQKKPTILGSELDFQLNPNAYPPPRIQTLKHSSPCDVTFVEITAGENCEQTFQLIEEEIMKILDLQKEFSVFSESHTFSGIPRLYHSPDLFVFHDYLSFHPNDFINALYFQLKEGHWNVIESPPPISKSEQYDKVFNRQTDHVYRNVISIDQKDPPDPVFEKLMQMTTEYTWKLTQWKADESNYFTISEILNFIAKPTNLYAYAGSKFDLLFSSANKKYQLGLPLSFFDFSQWNMYIEYQNISEELLFAFHDAACIETFLDAQSGILWVLVMKPIPKTMGTVLSNEYMPLCIENITDYLNHVFSQKGNEANVKKSRNPPTPAQIVKDKLDISLIMPSIESKIENSKNCYELPVTVFKSKAFVSPYLFENGLFVQIHRDVIFERPTFSYQFYYKNIIDCKSNSDSVVFCPIEGIRLLYEFGQSLTVFFNEQTICFDGQNLHIISTNEKNLVITKSGSLIFTNKNDIKVIVYSNGSISRLIDNKWIAIDKNGKSLDGIDRQHSEIIDERTQSRHMVRPDNIEYTIMKDGKRQIIVDLDTSIEQTSNEITFILPGFPIIHWDRQGFKFDIDCFKFEIDFIDDEFLSVTKTSQYTIRTDQKSVLFNTNGCEAYLTKNACQFNIPATGEYLIADKSGTEKICNLATEEQKGKKKVEYIESKWGTLIPIKETIQEPQQLKLHQLFLPRFFGIRRNLSGFEFIREDSIKTDGLTLKKSHINDMYGNRVDLVSFHEPHMMPSLYMVFEGLSKPNRALILKDLHIPKAPPANKKTKIVDLQPFQTKEHLIQKAEDIYLTYLDNCSTFCKQLDKTLESLHEEYLKSLEPPPPPEERIIFMPPSTPPPRILNMIYQLHDSNTNECNLSYWNSPESDFSYPLEFPKVLEREFSPRLALFDPPRAFQQQNERITPRETDDAFVTQSEPSVRSGKTIKNEDDNANNIFSSKTWKLNTVHSKHDSINFGDVLENHRKFASLKIQNISKKPLHYAFDLSEDTHSIRICSIPGVIFPGLQTTIKVELMPSNPGVINDSFIFRTRDFDLKIPVTANVIADVNKPKNISNDSNE